MIVLSVVNEVMVGEQAALVGPHGCWNARRNAGSLARQHLLAVEVAAIRQSCKFFAPHRVVHFPGHRLQLGSVVADIDHFVGHDQMMFGIDRLAISSEADALFSDFGGEAYAEAWRRASEASSDSLASDWSVVAATTARRSGMRSSVLDGAGTNDHPDDSLIAPETVHKGSTGSRSSTWHPRGNRPLPSEGGEWLGFQIGQISCGSRQNDPARNGVVTLSSGQCCQ